MSEEKDINLNEEELVAEETEETSEECCEECCDECCEEEYNKEYETEISEDQNPQEDELAKKIEFALSSANDKYLRLYAEYENYRKRTSKEKIEAYGDATSRCISEILPVIDNFERALGTECNDEKYKSGIEMIFNQFKNTLEKIGVKEMEALNKPFDPNMHNAIKQVEDENFEENTVCEVFQKGYLLGDKVIRHAMVAVAN